MAHKIHRRLLPHFFVDPNFAKGFAGQAHPLSSKKVHHSAHSLTLPALFLYLQLLLVVTVTLFVTSRTVPQILGTRAFSTEEIIKLTNEKRGEYGLAPLVASARLSRAAEAKASDMITFDYWAHNSPSGRTPWSFISSAGYRYLFAGENLARDFTDPGSVVSAWMNSPTHRANLLDKNFREIGVAAQSGKLSGREGTLVVQMFGARGDVRTLTEGARGVQGAQEEEPAVPEPAVVLATQKFAVARVVSLAVVGFIFSLLLLEAIVTVKRADMQVKSSIFAHLAILGFVLLAVWYALGGAIL